MDLGAVDASPSGDRGPDLFDAWVDVGTWERFTPSLASFLDHLHDVGALPAPSPGPSHHGAPPGQPSLEAAALLLRAPRPVVTSPGRARPPGPLHVLARASRRQPSPHRPRMVLAPRGGGVRVSLRLTDAQGRLVLGDTEQSSLAALGWKPDRPARQAGASRTVSRLLPDSATASRLSTRILIEILRVPHPADIDHLLVGP